MEKISIIGGGLSGSLLAVYMARRGFDVHLFERRPDMRNTKIAAGRSINLALSTRGIRALEKAGLENRRGNPLFLLTLTTRLLPWRS